MADFSDGTGPQEPDHRVRAVNDIPTLSDAGTSVPSAVVTLVHGTFGRDAAWTLPHSAFRAHLQRHLGLTLAVERFEWSGANSHAARVQAGVDLAAHQRVLFERYPMATHSIVAHSHGGNVACYALRDPFVRARLSSLVTIGTPFITCRPRRTPESINVLTFMAADFLAAVAACVTAAVGLTAAAWLTPLSEAGRYPTAMEIATWGTAGTGAAGANDQARAEAAEVGCCLVSSIASRTRERSGTPVATPA